MITHTIVTIGIYFKEDTMKYYTVTKKLIPHDFFPDQIKGQNSFSGKCFAQKKCNTPGPDTIKLENVLKSENFLNFVCSANQISGLAKVEQTFYTKKSLKFYGARPREYILRQTQQWTVSEQTENEIILLQYSNSTTVGEMFNSQGNICVTLCNNMYNVYDMIVLNNLPMLLFK